jgi:hypothetical protein
MMRTVVALAMDSGLSVEYWLEGDPRNLDTAMAIRAAQAKELDAARTRPARRR